MPLRFPVWLPEMPLTLVRRASAKLPRNNFIFRTDPKWTKQEIKEYLNKIYTMDVERVATINYLGKPTCQQQNMTCAHSAYSSAQAKSADDEAFDHT